MPSPVVPIAVPDGGTTVVQVLTDDAPASSAAGSPSLWGPVTVLMLAAILGLVCYGLGAASSSTPPVAPVAPAPLVKPEPTPVPAPTPAPVPVPLVPLPDPAPLVPLPTPPAPVPPPISPGTLAGRAAVTPLLTTYSHILLEERDSLLAGKTPAEARYPIDNVYIEDMRKVFRDALAPGLATIARSGASPADQTAAVELYLIQAAAELSRIADLNGPTPGRLAPGHILPRLLP